MLTTPAEDTSAAPARRARPLYAAGFAFGPHSIAASLGSYTKSEHASLLALGPSIGCL
jgi:hypothetical protein